MKKLLFLSIICAIVGGCNDCCSMSDCCGEMETSSDCNVTMRVKNAIMTDSCLCSCAKYICVSTRDGVVTITGSVPSQDDMDRIVNKVGSVMGVHKINNQMTVSN